jgi:hypothetical protein
MCICDQFRRPTLEDAIARFSMVRGALMGEAKRPPKPPSTYQRDPPSIGEALLLSKDGKTLLNLLAAAVRSVTSDKEELDKQHSDQQLKRPKARDETLLSDSRYFMENPSKITEHIYLGSTVAALNKKHLKETLEVRDARCVVSLSLCVCVREREREINGMS